jgi:hypothetical protein
MKQNTMLMIGGAIVVYLLWKKSQETTETTSEFSNIGGPYTTSGKMCFTTSNNDGSGSMQSAPCGDNAVPHPDGYGGGIVGPSGGTTVRRKLRRR